MSIGAATSGVPLPLVPKSTDEEHRFNPHTKRIKPKPARQ